MTGTGQVDRCSYPALPAVAPSTSAPLGRVLTGQRADKNTDRTRDGKSYGMYGTGMRTIPLMALLPRCRRTVSPNLACTCRDFTVRAKKLVQVRERSNSIRDE